MGIAAAPVNTSKIKNNWKKTAGASGYQVYRYDSSKKTWKCVKTISKGDTVSYVDRRLTSGAVYKYRCVLIRM